MNKKIFSKLCTKPKAELDRYANALDWFFSENKFDNNWDRIKAGQFTKKLKQRLQLLASKNGYKYKNVERFADDKTCKEPIIQHSSHESEGKDLVRHIRNGIAHGRVYFKYWKSTECIILTDYYYKGQTAFMYMPLEYLLIIHEVYKAVVSEKNKRKTKK